MREVGWVVAGTSLRLVNTNLQYSSNNKCEESHLVILIPLCMHTASVTAKNVPSAYSST